MHFTVSVLLFLRGAHETLHFSTHIMLSSWVKILRTKFNLYFLGVAIVVLPLKVYGTISFGKLANCTEPSICMEEIFIKLFCTKIQRRLSNIENSKCEIVRSYTYPYNRLTIWGLPIGLFWARVGHIATVFAMCDSENRSLLPTEING